MVRYVALLLAAAFSSACIQVGQSTEPATVDPAPGEVAFELAGPGEAVLVVQVSVNDQGPYPFVLDTGATLTCVDESLANELDLSEPPGTMAVGGGVRGLGPMRVVSIDSVAVGEARATDLLGCAVDLSAMQKAGLDLRGLLGLNFLKAYRVTLDFDRRTARFEP